MATVGKVELSKIYVKSSYFIEIQTEVFRFLTINLIKRKNYLLISLEGDNFSLNQKFDKKKTLDELSLNIIQIKEDMNFLINLIFSNIKQFLQKIKYFKQSIKLNIIYLK